jgi:CHASE2 domain-containing sensor protein
VTVIEQFSDWPKWVQYLVLIPHGILGFVATWLWWPKSDQSWQKFGLVAAYLLVFLLVMRYVFHFR